MTDNDYSYRFIEARKEADESEKKKKDAEAWKQALDALKERQRDPGTGYWLCVKWIGDRFKEGRIYTDTEAGGRPQQNIGTWVPANIQAYKTQEMFDHILRKK